MYYYHSLKLNQRNLNPLLWREVFPYAIEFFKNEKIQEQVQKSQTIKMKKSGELAPEIVYQLKIEFTITGGNSEFKIVPFDNPAANASKKTNTNI